MPIFEFSCTDCGGISEIIMTKETDIPVCAKCGSRNLTKLLSPSAAYSGTSKNRLPGAGDTGCCGHAPGEGSCQGPGSCCGKS